MLKPANDALFGFVDKLINTGYLSSKLALNRVRSQSQATKKIEDQIEQLLESLPSFHVPVWDDLHSVNSDTRDEKVASEWLILIPHLKMFVYTYHKRIKIFN